MGAGALELVVQRAPLMQHAVQDIRRDPPRRKTRHFGWQGDSLRRHGAGISRRHADSDQRYQLTPSGIRTPLPCEYAKYKNRPGMSGLRYDLGPEWVRVLAR